MLIDIGNTNIKIKTNKELKVFKTKANKNLVLNYIKKHNYKKIYIASVVKEYTLFFKQHLKKQAYYFSYKNKFSFKFNLQGMGIDRLLADEGALLKYRSPLMVIDAGSAITIDYIDAKYNLKGGLILAGINLTAKALNNYASLLPIININEYKDKKISRKQSYLSNNTDDAIFYGIINPVISCIEDFYNSFNVKDLKIILTGGDSNIIYNYLSLKKNTYIEKDLIFQGMKNLIKKEGL